MEKLILTWIILLFSLNISYAQTNVVRAEYFINNDPGFGAGITIPINPGPSPELIFNANTTALPTGYHTVYVRAQDENGVWSFLESRQFYVLDPVSITPPTIPNITEVEYFINTDPGQGLAIKINVPDGLEVNLLDLVSTNPLVSGYHTIGFRARTANGNWGWTEYRNFYITTTGSVVETPKLVVAAEYFIDIDPGQGQATALGSFGATSSIDLNELIPDSLASGYHSFNVRSKDEDGKWGFVERRPVYVTSSGNAISLVTDINKIEYFFDGNDPGVGQGINLPVIPGQEIEFNTIDIATASTLIDGQHTITFRARNGNGWGLAEIDTFNVLDDCMQPIAAFTPALACAGQPVTFVDNSTNLQPDATYRWYLDGDNTIDDTTVGNASFTYPNPGTYVVSLAIRQGTICLDSISNVFTIKPLPAVVFSSTGTATNQPTTFEASTVNLDPAATWNWDFDSDGTPESTNPNTATYTYTSDGSYTTTLIVSDGLGCEVTTTKSITVGSGGGGAPLPSADFLTSNGCVGNPISFIDLSRDLPVDATYSWDFDGDASTDGTTKGSTNYIYSTAGSYSAKLIIDLGGSTIEKTRQVEIADLPIVDFSSTKICEGSAVDFTDLSTQVSPAAVYMWDFNNDGIVDSNAQTNISYTYAGSGSFITRLKIDNGFGCATEVVKQVNVIAKANPNFDWNVVCTGETVTFNNLSTGTIAGATYSWDLDGNGTEDATSAGVVNFVFPSKGIYNASLTINNIAGCSATLTKSIEIIDRPDVALQINAQCYGQESQMIDLSQNVSTDASYRWDFQSDGVDDDFTVGSTGFTYPSYNSYIVKLTIDNGGNCVASTEQLVEFADAAKPNFATNKLCEGEEVIFTNLSTDVNPAAIYSWDFDGDGLEDSAFPGSTAHTFPDADIYNATLTIDNGGNCLAYKIIPLEITPPPAVDLGEDKILCEAGTVTFDAGLGYVSYLWPDGSNQQTYTVDQIGEYKVRVQDAKGCYNSDTIAVKLLGSPTPAFSYSFDLSFQGIRVIFTNNSVNASSYQWDFGEGTTTEEVNPSFVFGDYSFYQTSVYNVCLTAFNLCDEVKICEQIFVSPTDFLEEAGELIEVYPNPSTAIVNLKLNSNTDYKEAALLNANGEILWSQTDPTNDSEIDVSSYSSGIYYIVVASENQFFFKKVMKK